MSLETAWKVVSDNETFFVRSDRSAGEIMDSYDQSVMVTAVFYEDQRTEWDRVLSLAQYGNSTDVELDTDTDPEAIVDALNFEIIGKYFDSEVSDELERVGTNWETASETERMAFMLLVDKLQRMSNKAERLLNNEYFGSSRLK